MTDTKYIVTPIGRLVQGDPFTPKTTDMKGKPRTDKQGNPRSEWFIALAIAKSDPGLNAFKSAIATAAQQDWPGGEWQRSDFFWKMVDGDTQEHHSKTGFSGHFVFRMTNGYPIKIYTKDGEQQIVDQSQIKRGDYFRASVSVKGNGDQTNPGIYINVWLLEHLGYGEEIVGGPTAKEVFGSNAVTYIPPGLSKTPVASGPGLSVPESGITQPASPIQPPSNIATPQLPPVQMNQMNQMAQQGKDFLTPKTPDTPKYEMTEKAGQITYEQFIEVGWTHEKLVQEGYIKELTDMMPF
jgi:hypothetical protein